MRVLVVAPWFAYCEPVLLVNGLRAAGHEVITAGPSYGLWTPWQGGLMLPDKYEPFLPASVLPRPDVLSLPTGYEPRLSQVLERFGDIDLVIHTDFTYRLIMDVPGVKSVLYCADNHARTYMGAESFDLVFCGHAVGYHTELPQARPYLGGVDEWCYDLGGDRPFDVCMIGAWYERRKRTLIMLLDNGVTVAAGCGILYDDYNRMCNTAKMAVCVSSQGNDFSARILGHMAQGCLTLVERGILDGDGRLYNIVDGQHCLTFSDDADLLRKIAWGRDSGLRRVITERGKAHVKQFTWRRTAESIIREVGK